MQDIRTDMALEARELIGGDMEGVTLEEEEMEDCSIARVRVLSEAGSRKLGKSMGTYVTADMRGAGQLLPRQIDAIARRVGKEIVGLVGGAAGGQVLVVGLGNRMVTPDSLGPKVCDRVFVTRHIKEHLPDILDAQAATVSAISPGVLGITGVETVEVVYGVAERIRPDVIIAIDALASRRARRIGASVQISDAGISPGSGIGNHRRPIDKKAMGCPVIAVGAPMVAYASTVARDIIEEAAGESEAKSMGQLIDRFVPDGGMIVTPKNIDLLTDKMADIIAMAINYALHPSMSPEDIREFME